MTATEKMIATMTSIEILQLVLPAGVQPIGGVEGDFDITDTRHSTDRLVTDSQTCQVQSENICRDLCRTKMTGIRPTNFIYLLSVFYKANIKVTSLNYYPLYL